MSDRPWMKFYPRDWRGDQALRFVSIGARGLWIEMLCIMHEADPYGHLVMNGQKISAKKLSAMVGISEDECVSLLAELQHAGVFSVTKGGSIFSRRMSSDRIREEKGRNAVRKRWEKDVENAEENDPPNRLDRTPPITHIPDTRVKRESKEDSEVSTSAPANAVACISEPVDVRTKLWREGIPILVALIGKSESASRKFLGRCLQVVGDDASRMLLILHQAASARPADAASWISAAVKSASPAALSGAQAIREQANLPTFLGLGPMHAVRLPEKR